MPEDRLAAYSDDWDDLMLALAMKIVSGEKDNAETVEAVLARAEGRQGRRRQVPGGRRSEGRRVESRGASADRNGPFRTH